MQFIKLKINTLIYGPHLAEAIKLDMLLNAMHDGNARPQANFLNRPGEITLQEVERKTAKLLTDGFFNAVGNNYIITANGILHLAKGGYAAEVKQSKRVGISFWLSIMAFLMAFISFVVTLLNSFRILPKN